MKYQNYDSTTKRRLLGGGAVSTSLSSLTRRTALLLFVIFTPLFTVVLSTLFFCAHILYGNDGDQYSSDMHQTLHAADHEDSYGKIPIRSAEHMATP